MGKTQTERAGSCSRQLTKGQEALTDKKGHANCGSVEGGREVYDDGESTDSERESDFLLGSKKNNQLSLIQCSQDALRCL